MFMNATAYGVEVEFCGITRAKAASIIAEHFNAAVFHDDTTVYDTRIIRDGQRRKWAIMRDSSINASEDKKCELVTPVLKGDDDIITLQEIIRKLRANGACVNESCGIHVHVSHKNITANVLRRLAIQWASKETAVYEAIKVIPSREAYCEKSDKNFIEAVKKLHISDGNYAAVSEAWYNTQSDFRSRNAHYHSSRYHGLNFHSFFNASPSTRNVEFRCFNSTLHAGKVKAYIQYCVAVVNHAIEKKSARYQNMPAKKANMADWFVRIGLTGEKYKTCRLHMSAGLAA